MKTQLSAAEINRLEAQLAEQATGVETAVPPFVPTAPGANRTSAASMGSHSLFRAAVVVVVALLGVGLFALDGRFTDTAASTDAPTSRAESDGVVPLNDLLVWTPANRFDLADEVNALGTGAERARRRSSLTIEEFDTYWEGFPDVLDYGVPVEIWRISPQAWRVTGAEQSFTDVDQIAAIDWVVRVEPFPQCTDDPTATVLFCDHQLDDPGFLPHEQIFTLLALAAAAIATFAYRQDMRRAARVIAALSVPVILATWILVSPFGDALALAEPIIAEGNAQVTVPFEPKEWINLQSQGYTTGGVPSPIPGVDPALSDQLRSIDSLWTAYFPQIFLGVPLAAMTLVVGLFGLASTVRSRSGRERTLVGAGVACLLASVLVPFFWLLVSTDPALLEALSNFLE